MYKRSVIHLGHFEILEFQLVQWKGFRDKTGVNIKLLWELIEYLISQISSVRVAAPANDKPIGLKCVFTKVSPESGNDEGYPKTKDI